MKKRLLGILLCLSLLLATVYTPLALKASSTATEQTAVQEYINSSTAPTKSGYVFSGWYEDQEYKKPISDVDSVPTSGAYAKFVDRDVLAFKGQLLANVTPSSTSTNLRLITAVDTTLYKEVGFKLSRDDNKIAQLSSKVVYETIVGYTDGNQINYRAEEVFCKEAAYFATKEVKLIPNEDFGRVFTATPYWVTMDGTMVEGITRTFKIVDGIPVQMELSMEATEDTRAGIEEALVVDTSENVAAQLIINGNEDNVYNITLNETDSGTYQGRVLTCDMINDLKIGNNTLTVRAIKTDTEGNSRITEKDYTYQNDGFLYVRDTDGALEYATDGDETVLKYTETTITDGWEGFGSRYISVANANGGFTTRGVKYITMKIKLVDVDKISLLYDAPDDEPATNDVNVTIQADQTSQYIENSGVMNALVQNEWITVKIPTAYDPAIVMNSVVYRNFNINHTSGTLYIKNVQYHTDEYVTPIASIGLTDETRELKGESASQGLGMIRVEATEAVPVELIINGDEINKISLGTLEEVGWNNEGRQYMGWYNVSPWVNDLRIGNNTLTIRATKTGANGGTLTVEKDFDYVYKGFLFENSDKQSLEVVNDVDGAPALKFQETGTPDNVGDAVHSYYVTYNDAGTLQGYYHTNGIKYITMEVKVTEGTGFFVRYTGPTTDNEYALWNEVPFGAETSLIDNNGAPGTFEKDKWVTVKIPLKSNGQSAVQYDYREFSFRPLGNNGVMYIRNVQYRADTVPSVQITTDDSGYDTLKFSVGENIETQLIINGDKNNAITLEKTAAEVGFEGSYRLKDLMSKLNLGVNKLTVCTADGGKTTIEYTNTGFLYARDVDGVLESADMDGETVLKYTEKEDTTPGEDWLGIGSTYISSADNLVGDFATDGVKYMTMTVKLVGADSISLLYDAPDHEPTANDLQVTFQNGETSPYLTKKGAVATMEKNEWITIKLPLAADASALDEGRYRNFNINMVGGTLYIKDVQYHTDEYVTPIDLELTDETRNITKENVNDFSQGLGQIRVEASEGAVAQLIINGDETKTISLGTLTEQTFSNAGRKYMVWYNVSPWLNQLHIGDNILTIRATKTTASGVTLTAEKDFTYNYKGFTYVENEAHSLTETLDEKGNPALKFKETGVAEGAEMLQNGIRSYYVTYTGQSQGYYIENGIKYITMEVKVSQGTGLFIAYTGPEDDKEASIWEKITFGGSGEKVTVIGSSSGTGTLKQGEWTTIQIPLGTNGQSSAGEGHWRNFYVRPYGNNGEMYIRNVQYCTISEEAPNIPEIANESQYVTYYFDSKSGNDANAGTVKTAPKKSLEAINSVISYVCQDTPVRILIKAGSEYTGMLQVRGFEALEDTPLIIDVYGKTDDKQYAKINGNANSNCVTVGNSNVRISGLETTGQKTNKGIEISPIQAGAMKNVVITGNYCHDINFDVSGLADGLNSLPAIGTAPDLATVTQICADDVYSTDKGGIVAVASTAADVGASWFENLWIENNKIERVSRSGIWVFSKWTHRPGFEWGYNVYVDDSSCSFHKNVVVRDNYISHAGGDSIVMGGVDGGWLEGNTSYYAQYLGRTDFYNAAIWTHTCKNIMFQRNEAAYTYRQNGAGDGQGFDIDIGNTNITFQYNYAHHNEGGGIMFANKATATNVYDASNNVVSETRASEWKNVVIRNNVFVDNQRNLIEVSGYIGKFTFENNTAVLPAEASTETLIDSHDLGSTGIKGGGWEFKNNIFRSRNPLKMTINAWYSESATFNTNVFYGFSSDYEAYLSSNSFQLPISIKNAIFVDPEISLDGTAEMGYASLAAFKPSNPNILTGALSSDTKGMYDAAGYYANGIPYFGAFSTLR